MLNHGRTDRSIISVASYSSNTVINTKNCYHYQQMAAHSIILLCLEGWLFCSHSTVHKVSIYFFISFLVTGICIYTWQKVIIITNSALEFVITLHLRHLVALSAQSSHNTECLQGWNITVMGSSSQSSQRLISLVADAVDGTDFCTSFETVEVDCRRLPW